MGILVCIIIVFLIIIIILLSSCIISKELLKISTPTPTPIPGFNLIREISNEPFVIVCNKGSLSNLNKYLISKKTMDLQPLVLLLQYSLSGYDFSTLNSDSKDKFIKFYTSIVGISDESISDESINKPTIKNLNIPYSGSPSSSFGFNPNISFYFSITNCIINNDSVAGDSYFKFNISQGCPIRNCTFYSIFNTGFGSPGFISDSIFKKKIISRGSTHNDAGCQQYMFNKCEINGLERNMGNWGSQYYFLFFNCSSSSLTFKLDDIKPNCKQGGWVFDPPEYEILETGSCDLNSGGYVTTKECAASVTSLRHDLLIKQDLPILQPMPDGKCYPTDKSGPCWHPKAAPCFLLTNEKPLPGMPRVRQNAISNTAPFNPAIYPNPCTLSHQCICKKPPKPIPSPPSQLSLCYPNITRKVCWFSQPVQGKTNYNCSSNAVYNDTSLRENCPFITNDGVYYETKVMKTIVLKLQQPTWYNKPFLKNTAYIIPAGFYYVQSAIIVPPGTILFGLGFVILDFNNNKEEKMDAVTLGEGSVLYSIIVNAPKSDLICKTLITMGKSSKLFDVFTRVLQNVSASTECHINVIGDNCYLEDVWCWDADHTINSDKMLSGGQLMDSVYGLKVIGNNTTCVGLFVEHQLNPITWYGDNGKIYFLEGETNYYNSTKYLQLNKPNMSFTMIAGNIYSVKSPDNAAIVFPNNNTLLNCPYSLPVKDAGIYLSDVNISAWNKGSFTNAINNKGGPIGDNSKTVIICDLKKYMQEN